MSTKIYDAYSMKGMNTKELNIFIKELKNLCMEKVMGSVDKLLAEEVTCLIDTKIINDNFPQYNQQPYNKFLTTQYNRAFHSWRHKLQDRAKYEEECALKYFTDLEPGVFLFAKYIVANQIEIAEYSNFSLGYNMKNDIVIFPISKKRILFMVFGDVLRHLMYNIIEDHENVTLQAFKLKYGIKDYHYQNQTDRPDDVSAQEWGRRKRDWDLALKTSIPSIDGINIELINAEQISREMVLRKNNNALDFFNCNTSRAAKYATDMVLLDVNKTSLASEYLHNSSLLKEQIANNSGDLYDKYYVIYNNLISVLPNITKELLIKFIL